MATVLVTSDANAASTIQLKRIQYDSPGSDTRSNASLNGEYFTLKNVSGKKLSLRNYTVRDKSGHTYKFTTTYYLAAGASVRVHTGKGTNTATNRYWGLGSYVWNNTGDKASLKNSAGTTLDTCTWSSAGAGYKNC